MAEGAYGDDDVATTALVGGFMLTAGPQTVAQIAAALTLPTERVDIALARLEADGRVLQGSFTGAKLLEWCERGLLQRIHRRTIGTLRERARPVAPSEFVRFLLRWQHVMPGTRLHGVEGVAKVIEQLEGLELPAAAWEREILPARVHDYAPAMLDELCLSGEVAWARLRVTPPEGELNPRARAGAIGLFARPHAGWLIDPYARTDEPASTWAHCRRWRARSPRCSSGAAPPSSADLAGALSRAVPEVEDALWELARTGAVTSDGFAGLRALLDAALGATAPRCRRPLVAVASRCAAPRRGRRALRRRQPRRARLGVPAPLGRHDAPAPRARIGGAAVARSRRRLSPARGARRDPRRPLRQRHDRRAVRAARGGRGAARAAVGRRWRPRRCASPPPIR